MSGEKISVFIKEPCKKMRHVNISNTLENLQKTVGGHIETVTFFTANGETILMIVNEEGKLNGLPFNFSFFFEFIYGTAIFCGAEGEEFADVPMDWEQAKRVFGPLMQDGWCG